MRPSETRLGCAPARSRARFECPTDLKWDLQKQVDSVKPKGRAEPVTVYRILAGEQPGKREDMATRE